MSYEGNRNKENYKAAKDPKEKMSQEKILVDVFVIMILDLLSTFMTLSFVARTGHREDK